MDRQCEDVYKQLLVEVLDDPALPVVCNLNIGHAAPRCILPFGVRACVDAVSYTHLDVYKRQALHQPGAGRVQPPGSGGVL